MFQVILGMVEDEANDLFFNQEAVRDGIGPQTRDQYLRTLIRNTYNYHMNEIFATVQNEYIDWRTQVSTVVCDWNVTVVHKYYWNEVTLNGDKMY